MGLDRQRGRSRHEDMGCRLRVCDRVGGLSKRCHLGGREPCRVPNSWQATGVSPADAFSLTGEEVEPSAPQSGSGTTHEPTGWIPLPIFFFSPFSSSFLPPLPFLGNFRIHFHVLLTFLICLAPSVHSFCHPSFPPPPPSFAPRWASWFFSPFFL